MLSSLIIYNRAVSSAGASDKVKITSQTTVQREIDYFTSKAAKIKNANEFMSDHRMMRFALSAFSMESELQYMGRMKKVLLADPNEPRSIVNLMYDQRYKTINKYFDLNNSGVSKIKDPKVIENLVERYKTNTYENTLGNQNLSAADALYFKRVAPGVTSPYQIIADSGLRGVVMRALDIPEQAVMYSVDKQIKAMTDKGLNIKKMGDATYVDSLIKKFLVKSDIKQLTSQTNPLLDLFA